MTSNHTPGPYRHEGPDEFGDYNILHPADSLAVAAVVSNMRPPEEVKANADRLVAAWNACAGIPIEGVEAWRGMESIIRADEAERLLGLAYPYVRRAVKQIMRDAPDETREAAGSDIREIRAFLDGAKPQPDPLLVEARDFIRSEYEVLLMSVCPVVDGKPVREQCDVLNLEFVREYEALLAKMDEALKDA